MILKLAYYGDPILRKKTSPVDNIDSEIKKLIEDMVDTLHAHSGIGLAAPQVHHSLSIFITKVPTYDPKTFEEIIPGELVIFINPKIISISEETRTGGEGCLSIPRIYEKVTRPAHVTVEAINLEGELFQREVKGLEASCVLHENDHINGVLFIDRIDKKRRKAIDPFLRKIKKEFYIQSK